MWGRQEPLLERGVEFQMLQLSNESGVESSSILAIVKNEFQVGCWATVINSADLVELLREVDSITWINVDKFQ